jgi:hypothetical protein
MQDQEGVSGVQDSVVDAEATTADRFDMFDAAAAVNAV